LSSQKCFVWDPEKPLDTSFRWYDDPKKAVILISRRERRISVVGKRYDDPEVRRSLMTYNLKLIT